MGEVLEDLQRDRTLAPSTVMTVMDNLHRKGVLGGGPRLWGNPKDARTRFGWEAEKGSHARSRPVREPFRKEPATACKIGTCWFLPGVACGSKSE